MPTRTRANTRSVLARLQFLPNDIQVLIFEQLIGDYTTLKAISLTSRSWRKLSLPSLFHDVDISFHNDGRLPEWESPGCTLMPWMYADHLPVRGGDYKSVSFKPRQEAFLTLLTERPEFASYVKRLTWTLVWTVVDPGSALPVAERQTWNVLNRLTSVTHLDLASLHEVGDQPLVHQNPPELFPMVTNLRLVGHMHRQLVEAILKHPERIRTLDLHHLDDEGSLPGGVVMTDRVPSLHSYTYSRGNRSPVILYRSDQVIDDDLYLRQMSGHAVVFPGPMWFALRLVSLSVSPVRLKRFMITLATFDDDADMRNYNTTFREITNILRTMRHSLEHVEINVGEPGMIFLPYKTCRGTTMAMASHTRCLEFSDISYRELLFAFLEQLVQALYTEVFNPRLRVKLRGFRMLDGSHNKQAEATTEQQTTFQLARNCSLVDEESMEEENLDYHLRFWGYEYGPDIFELMYLDALSRS